jgi:hypothetical protein
VDVGAETAAWESNASSLQRGIIRRVATSKDDAGCSNGMQQEGAGLDGAAACSDQVKIYVSLPRREGRHRSAGVG